MATTLEQIKHLLTTPEETSALASEYILDQEKTTAKIIQMAADKGFDLKSDEIIQHLTQMNEEDELDDLELSTEALAAVAGGFGWYQAIRGIQNGDVNKYIMGPMGRGIRDADKAAGEHTGKSKGNF